MDRAAEVPAHSAPTALWVEVRDEDGRSVAFVDQLVREEDAPMTRLLLKDGKVERSETWPTASDLGLPVILPGGEIGILTSWENAEDHSQWPWAVEF